MNNMSLENVGKKARGKGRRGRRPKRETPCTGNDTETCDGDTLQNQQSDKNEIKKNSLWSAENPSIAVSEKSDECPHKSSKQLEDTAVVIDAGGDGNIAPNKTDDPMSESAAPNNGMNETRIDNEPALITSSEDKQGLQDVVCITLSQATKIIPRFSKKRKAKSHDLKTEPKCTKISVGPEDIPSCSVSLECLSVKNSDAIMKKPENPEENNADQTNAKDTKNESLSVDSSEKTKSDIYQEKVSISLPEEGVNDQENTSDINKPEVTMEPEKIAYPEEDPPEITHQVEIIENRPVESGEIKHVALAIESNGEISAEDEHEDATSERANVNTSAEVGNLPQDLLMGTDISDVIPSDKATIDGENQNQSSIEMPSSIDITESDVISAVSACVAKLEPLQELGLTDSQLCELDEDMDQEPVTGIRSIQEKSNTKKTVPPQPNKIRSTEGMKSKSQAATKMVKGAINELCALNNILLKAKRDIESYKRQRAAAIAQIIQSNQYSI